MHEENQRTKEKTAEASMDWKPNECTALRLGIESRLSGAQHRGRTAMTPASQKYQILSSLNPFHRKTCRVS